MCLLVVTLELRDGNRSQLKLESMGQKTGLKSKKYLKIGAFVLFSCYGKAILSIPMIMTLLEKASTSFN